MPFALHERLAFFFVVVVVPFCLFPVAVIHNLPFASLDLKTGYCSSTR